MMRSYVAWHASCRCLMTVDREGRSDWPLRSSDGRVLYDHPERLTKAVRKAVAQAYKRMDRGEDPATFLPVEG